MFKYVYVAPKTQNNFMIWKIKVKHQPENAAIISAASATQTDVACEESPTRLVDRSYLMVPDTQVIC